MKRLTVAAAVMLGCPLFIVSGVSKPQSQDAVTEEKTVVFAVWPAIKWQNRETPLFDSIVVLNDGRLETPPNHWESEPWTVPAMELFNKTYFAPGRRYSMLSHGAVHGSATVKEIGGVGCMDLMAKVEPSQPLPKDRMLLAASSPETLGLHPNRDRPVTTEDRSAFVHVASNIFKSKIAWPPPASSVKIDDLQSISLSADLPNALVGTVTVTLKKSIHHLFLLALKKDQEYIAEASSYFEAVDYEDQGYDDVDSETFADHLDLNHDGVDEIITMREHGDGRYYFVYQRQNGKWEEVYQGGGGGC